MRHARRRGCAARPTGERSTISVTSFANSHIITCAGNGGMVMVDDEALRDRALMLRRWGRRSELHFFGSKRRDRDFWEDLDGIHYDNQFIFDELAWNFEPSEMGAAFGLEQLKKLPDNLARRRRNFDALHRVLRGPRRSLRAARGSSPELETAWLGYPLIDQRPTPGSSAPTCRSSSTAAASTPARSGPATSTRQPMLRGRRRCGCPTTACPNADAVMERGVLLPLSHALDDDDPRLRHRPARGVPHRALIARLGRHGSSFFPSGAGFVRPWRRGRVA